MSKPVDPTASNLARHFAWKERVRKEQGSVYNSLEKCISMGILKKLPLKEEEVLALTPTSKQDPYKLLQKLKESVNEGGSSPSKLDSTADASPTLPGNRFTLKQFETQNSGVVLPKLTKTRLSSNEDIPPYSEFIVGSQSSVKKEAPLLNYKSAGMEYKPQKSYTKQYTTYMHGSINLKQPNFEYLAVKNLKKGGFDESSPSLKGKDVYYSSKKGEFVLSESPNMRHKNKPKDNLFEAETFSSSPLKRITQQKAKNGNKPPSRNKMMSVRKSLDDLKIAQEVEKHIPEDSKKTLEPIRKSHSKIYSKINKVKPLRNSSQPKISTNGRYLTQNVSCGLDLKAKTRMAIQHMKARKLKNAL